MWCCPKFWHIVTVDVHTHYFAEALLDNLNEMLVDRIGDEASIRMFYESEDLGLSTEGADERVEMMDDWGLETAVVSFPSPESFVDEKYLSRPVIYRRLSEIINDHVADAHDRYPDRIMGFASVPLVDAEAAKEELDRAIDDLGLQGAVLDTNVFGRHLTDEEFQPFFEHANDRALPIFLHPTNPAGKDRMDRFYSESIVGFPMDTTLAATYMIFSGFMEEYDDLEIILSHLGGALPYLRRRLSFLYSPNDAEFQHDVIAPLEREPVDYVQDFWYDTAMTFPTAMEMAMDVVGDRLLFGSDYPFGPKDSVTTGDQQIEELGVDTAQADRILEGHARDLLLNV